MVEQDPCTEERRRDKERPRHGENHDGTIFVSASLENHISW